MNYSSVPGNNHQTGKIVQPDCQTQQITCTGMHASIPPQVKEGRTLIATLSLAGLKPTEPLQPGQKAHESTTLRTKIGKIWEQLLGHGRSSFTQLGWHFIARHFFPPSSTERVTMPSGTTRTQAKVAAANWASQGNIIQTCSSKRNMQSKRWRHKSLFSRLDSKRTRLNKMQPGCCVF